ncbi:hydrolase, CocE/NonD family [Bacillus sp. JCM 19046]|nr:hydrolase, CocE/NonD family [Bacillus sp. JCM 19046]
MTTTILIEKNIPSPLSDGTILYADVYRPSAEGQYPTLLARLLDGKDSHRFRYLDLLKVVQAGYVIVLQDVRGRHQSEGTFSPFIQELNDGIDAVNWAASLPYSNGAIGMFGDEYSAFTQQTLATADLEPLKALFPVHSFSTQGEFTHKNGLFKLADTMGWALSIAEDEIKRKDNTQTGQDYLMHWKAYTDNIERFYHYEPQKAPLFKMLDASLFFYDLSKQPQEVAKVANDVPSYFVSGWFDSFLGTTIEAFSRSSKQEDVPHTLLIGPWSTGAINKDLCTRNFGTSASLHSISNEGSLTDIHLRWFDRWLKQEKNGIEHEAPVQLFVMGINKWRKETQWPPVGLQELQLHFCNKENQLLKNPVTHFNDSITIYKKQAAANYLDQTFHRYQTTCLSEALEVIGETNVIIQVDSLETSIHLSAALYDITANGDYHFLTEGTVTIEQTRTPQEVTIRLSPTANHFKKGHRIAVAIGQTSTIEYEYHVEKGNKQGSAINIILTKAILSLPFVSNPLS